MSTTQKRSRLLDFALIFVIAYIGSQIIFTWVFPQEKAGEQPKGIFLEMEDATIRGGNFPVVVVHNDTDASVQLPMRCPMPPLDLYRVIPAASGSGETLEQLTATETAIPCEDIAVIAPKTEASVSLSPWKYSMFGTYGTYEVRLTSDVSADPSAIRFEMYEPRVFVKMFRTFITEPFLNALVFFAGILPDHNLGIAIIILTLLVKILLFVPTQRSLEGQKKMQLLQPKLDDLKKQYSGDPKKLQEETVKLWKKEGVNPFQSCLPILLQFPILIGLFYVIRDGSVLELSREHLYGSYENLAWSFNPHFLGLDLRYPNVIVMPILLAVLQFIQMKLTFAVATNKAKHEGKPQSDSQRTQQIVMTYALPVLIGVFAFQFPAAVAVYWGVSTVFAIGQQLIVNREHLRLKTKLPKE